MTCDLRPATWDLGPVTCDLRPVTCDLRPGTCDLRFVPAGISGSIGIKNRIRIRVRLCKWMVTQDDAKRPWKMFGFYAQGCVHLKHAMQT